MPSSLLAVQVFLPLYPGNALRGNLDSIISTAPEYAGFEQKRQFYHRVASLIVPAVPWIELGNWEYTDDSSEAESEYERWCKGTVEDAREMEETAAQAMPFRTNQTRYMFLTQLFLLEQGSTTEQYVAQNCNVPQDRLWTKQTFHTLLSIIPMLNFLHVISDAIYLCPGTEAQGLDQSELQAEKYSYLRRLT